MVLKRCSFSSCSNDSSFANKVQMKGVCFIRFPNPKGNVEKCGRWVQACNRDDFDIDDVTEDTYICSKHFVGGNGPTVANPDPIPATVFQSEIESKHGISVNDNNETLPEKCQTQVKQSDSFGVRLSSNMTVFPLTLSDNVQFTKSTNNFASATKSRHLLSESEEGCSVDSSDILHANKSSYQEIINCKSNLQRTYDFPIQCNDITTESKKRKRNKLSKDSSKSSKYISTSSTESCDETAKGKLSCDMPSVSVPILTSSGASCQLVLSKLQDMQNSGGLPVLIKVLPNAAATSIVPTTAVAVIPVKPKKHWMESINSSNFCYKWASLGLSVQYANEKWIFTAINGCLAEKQLLLSPYGEYEVKVLGNCLPPEHLFFDGVPEDLNEEHEFHCLMNQFGRWKICAGNEVVEKAFEDTLIAVRAFVCNLTQTLRSKYCELLVNGNGPIRCKECKMLLNRIRRLKYQQGKTDNKNLTDVSENEQSQHSISDVDVLCNSDSTQKQNDHSNCSSFLSDKLSDEISTTNHFQEEPEDAVPADFLSMNLVEFASFS